jgi:hypothetical protein
MNTIAFERQTSPYRLSGELANPLLFSYLRVVSDDENEDEPTNVVLNPDGLINNLRRRYAFRNETEVRDFLEAHQFLIHVLLKADREIRKIFGAASRLVLRVVPDPEGEGEGELFLFIQTERHPQVARALLDELLRTWWLDAMLDAKGEMSISLEYV